MGTKKKKKAGNLRSKLATFLDFPEDVLGSIPKITVLGDKNIIIDNFKKLLELSEDYIKIETEIGVLCIKGEQLKIKIVDSEHVKIIGTLLFLEFGNKEMAKKCCT